MRTHTPLLSVVAALLCCINARAENTLPFIGILGVPSSVSCDTFTTRERETLQKSSGNHLRGDGAASCFANLYAKWVESAGGRAIGIPYNVDKSTLDTLLGSLNGVLFTGGGLSLGPETDYFQTAQYIFNKVQEMNDNGIHFPLHGTCMGFQLLSILGAQNHSVLVSGFDSEDYSIPLMLTTGASSSRIFGQAPRDVMNILATENVTANLHHSGVTPETFKTNDNLRDFYNVLSTNMDRKNRAFVSTIEAKNYPIHGTQWHPERPIFEWNPALNLNHTTDAITAMQYMANFFLIEARRNNQSFSSASELKLARSLVTYGMSQELLSSDKLTGYYALYFQNV
eukprot:gb/GECG01014167.1/.p1 GENE.gb/GECG01014167.1/~~gb/GECG01014167.1/.p1  ORF type:complete len:341 (+),score=28.45 gb/GECG01014167.1/:1-1023(+)